MSKIIIMLASLALGFTSIVPLIELIQFGAIVSVLGYACTAIDCIVLFIAALLIFVSEWNNLFD